MSQVDNILVGREDFVRVDNENPLSGSLGDHKEECSYTHKSKNVHLEGAFITGMLLSDGKLSGR